MSISDSPTTVTVRTCTLARLRTYKYPGATLDDVLNELMADTPPASFWREIDRRRAEPSVPGKLLLRKLRE